MRTSVIYEAPAYTLKSTGCAVSTARAVSTAQTDLLQHLSAFTPLSLISE